MAINYWDDVKEEVTGTYEQSNNFTEIPEGTEVLAHIETIKWDSFPGSSHQHINAKWCVIGDDYHGRKFFQSIYLKGSDPDGQYYKPEKAADAITSAKKMFMAIDKNAGGKICKLGQEPTNALMEQHIMGAQMLVTLGVNKSGKNIVRSVSPAPADTPKPTPKPKQDNGFDDSDPDMNIPF